MPTRKAKLVDVFGRVVHLRPQQMYFLFGKVRFPRFWTDQHNNKYIAEILEHVQFRTFPLEQNQHKITPRNTPSSENPLPWKILNFGLGIVHWKSDMCIYIVWVHKSMCNFKLFHWVSTIKVLYYMTMFWNTHIYMFENIKGTVAFFCDKVFISLKYPICQNIMNRNVIET